MRLPLFASIGKGTLGFLMVVTSIVAAMIYAQLHWDELRNKRRQVEQDEHSAAMAEYAHKAKADQIAEFKTLRATLVFYESGPRLADTLAILAQVLGDREAGVAREITKAYEECVTGTLLELAARYEGAPPKGEIVIVVGPPGEPEAASGDDIELALVEALKTASPAKAAGEVARTLGADRKALYARALELLGK